LQTALQALYGHYETTFKLWQDKGIKVPPCFIIVCQNTAISKLVYDCRRALLGLRRRLNDVKRPYQAWLEAACVAMAVLACSRRRGAPP
jgi:hypothetical protein